MSGSRPSSRELLALVGLIEDQRVAWPLTIQSVRSVGLPHDSAAANILIEMLEVGSSRAGAALSLRHLAKAYDTAARPPMLVASGSRPGSGTRDTAVVTDELFKTFERELLVAGFAVHQGDQIFATLAQRYDIERDLKVVLCLNVGRRDGETSAADAILAQFAKRLRDEEWPGKRMPAVYYDPRGLADDYRARAVLHAKCVIADRRRSLITSANFTLAAQEKNIEVGALIEDPEFGMSTVQHFEKLISDRSLLRLAL